MLYRNLGPGAWQLAGRAGDFAYEYKRVNTPRAARAAPSPRSRTRLLLSRGKQSRDDVPFRLSGRNLDRIGGFSCLGGRAIDDEPLAGGQYTDVVPTEHAVGGDAVAPRNSVESLAFLHDVHHPASARDTPDRGTEHGGQGLRADTRSRKGQQELEARADLRARGDAIGELELGKRDNMFRGETVEAVAPPHDVRLPGGERLVVGVEVPPERVHAVCGQHQRLRVRTRDHGAIERGVERDQFVHRHLRERRRKPNIDGARRGDRHEVGLVRDRLEARAESLRIRDDVFQRLQLGYVAARLRGHLKAQVISRQALRPVSFDRARHAVFTVVVGGERQVPVAVQLVQRLQIVERGAGGGDHVAT